MRDAVTKGSASSVDFKVKGDLHDMPFTDPRHGDFRIAARVADVTLCLRAAGGRGRRRTGPRCNGLSGELVFERAGMLVRNARGRIAGAPGVEVTKAEAQIADMAHHAPLLKVDAQAKGPLGELLRAGAPLAGEAGADAGAGARHRQRRLQAAPRTAALRDGQGQGAGQRRAGRQRAPARARDARR